ncbi:gelsolin [Mytilus galloprovincialis]|uniref:Actin-modulator n=1 Tax=Mytilus galloprovincialis TaxID=29158 RepID=A0A8B6D0L8_MYTGA|nr:gelsolin [Mytilus galloprovincialis]
MSGLIKQKQYDWKDSNLALFGSDIEKNVKKESAATEKAWKNAGRKLGIQIWRIVKFKVEDWPSEEYGKFYNGDSYIILNTYKEEDGEELCFDVHFWIGQYSTQDEYGTAAYKTVELDTFLNDAPIQHREVQGHESELFKSYFDNITILKGGADTGFRHVKPEEYTPRLFHFCGTRKHVEVREVPRNKDLLDSGDVYILDLGLQIYQWNGSGSNKDERMKAMQYCIKLKDERNGKASSEVLDEGSTDKDHEFYKALNEENVPDEAKKYKAADSQKELFRLSDASGSMKFSLAKKGQVSKADLDSKDVFILDSKTSLHVWVGKDTSVNERKNAMSYAHKYLQSTDHPFVSVSCLAEGMKSKAFELALAA